MAALEAPAHLSVTIALPQPEMAFIPRIETTFIPVDSVLRNPGPGWEEFPPWIDIHWGTVGQIRTKLREIGDPNTLYRVGDEGYVEAPVVTEPRWVHAHNFRPDPYWYGSPQRVHDLTRLSARMRRIRIYPDMTDGHPILDKKLHRLFRYVAGAYAAEKKIDLRGLALEKYHGNADDMFTSIADLTDQLNWYTKQQWTIARMGVGHGHIGTIELVHF